MAKRKSGSKCKMNSQIVKVSKNLKKTKKSKTLKNFRQPLSKLSFDIKDEPRRSKRNVSVTPSKEKNSVTPSENIPLKTPLKRHVTNQNMRDSSVKETTKSVQESSRLQGPTRRSNSLKLQNEPETFEITRKTSRKSSRQTPKRPLKETKSELISQIEFEKSRAGLLRNADPSAAYIRRSTRHATISQVSQKKSPADKSFGSFHGLAKKTFGSSKKKSLKSSSQTPKKETKRALFSQIQLEESHPDLSFEAYSDPPAASVRRSKRFASNVQIRLVESPAHMGFGAYHDLAKKTFESPATKPRKTRCQTPKKPLKRTKRALITQIKLTEESPGDVSFGAYYDPPASLRRSTRHASSSQIKVEESPADTGIGILHDLPKETFGSLLTKSQKIPSQTPKKPVNKTRRVLFSQIKLEASSVDVSLGAYNNPPAVRSARSTKRATMSKIDQEKSSALSLGRSTRCTPTSLINLKESSADMSFGADHDLDKETVDKRPSKSLCKTSIRIRKRGRSTSVKTLSPVIKKRTFPTIEYNTSDIHIAKKSLHVSAVPIKIPGREREFDDIYSFIETKISDESGGCMYVSGCPGTRKTATIREVLKCLQIKVQQKQLPSFECVEINGMQITEPSQAYVQIYRQFTGQTLPLEKAHLLLEKKFITSDMNRKATVLFVDELDILCNRRQDVIYNLLDWSTKQAAKLAVVTVANAVYLPERSLKGKISSRLGLTRVTFQPYTQKQLVMIVQARLKDMTNIFDNDAVELVARKVASMSGDCRRALDICRRAIEIAERDCCTTMNIRISMTHVRAAFNDMITNPKVLAIAKCSKYEKLFLQAVDAEVTRTGVDETNLLQVYKQYERICDLNGATLRMSSKLGSSRLLICEDSSASIHQKIMLNVSHDDIYQALHMMT